LFSQKPSKQWRCISKAIVLLATNISPKHKYPPMLARTDISSVFFQISNNQHPFITNAHALLTSAIC
jgi:hemoglobin-like flavoprotein